MKRLWDVVVLTLAVNFLALAGGVGWLYQSGRLGRDRISKIKLVLFPPPTTAPATTQPAIDATTRPSIELDALLARHSDMSAGQKVDFIRQTFDAEMAQLDRRARELADLKMQIDLANGKLTTDRAQLDVDRQKLTQQQEQARKLATDQGFQDSLNLYNAMPAKQVKQIFMSLSDDAMTQYLQAMDGRAAGKIIKEFKTPDEITRIQRILEKMRTGGATAQQGKP